MNSRNIGLLVFNLAIILGAVYLLLPNTPGIPGLGHEVKTYLGLDLVGGIQVLLEADAPAIENIDAAQLSESMATSRQIIENRVNGLGVAEAVVQLAGDRRIVVELPGVEDPDQAVATIRGTALLEFVNMGTAPLPAGTIITTDHDSGLQANFTQPGIPADQIVWPTIMTGADLRQAVVTTDQLGRYAVSFELTPNGSAIFSEYTSNNLGSYLAIVLDKEIISTPQVSVPITQGSGIIEGQFTYEEANNLAIQLRFGALPIPLRIVESRTVGPTLGQDSLQKSLVAGVIGLTIVMLFMGIYYRLPGMVANLAILVYAGISFALFRSIPVTLTLAGIAGLILSTGSALDANILIFERIKEELRNNRPLSSAVDVAWRRAWPSIRDSNIATLITCGILFWFGSAFGATIVKGFAITLAIGVGVSLYSALFVTRNILTLLLDAFKPTNLPRWFGI